MTTTTHRRTVAEMEKRLADARELIEKMRAHAEAEYAARGDYDIHESYSTSTGRSFDHGTRCGLDQALQIITACFDDPERDWMYQR